MADPVGTPPDGGVFEFVQAHPGIAIGGGVVLLLLIGGSILKTKQPATTNPNAPLGDLSGLQNGIVYVPTQTSFITNNKSGVFASNDPTLTTITTGPVNSPTSTSTTTTTNNPVYRGHPIPGPKPVPTPAPPPPPRNPPPPQPQPPVKAKGLIWDQRHTILGGETLSGIAATLTRQLRAQGMPGSQSITWQDLYAHNTAVINATSAAHHNPIPGGPWNDIFPGELISTPRWG